jgi:hypothetical protein
MQPIFYIIILNIFIKSNQCSGKKTGRPRSYVALVVRRVDVHTIPARGEVDLSTDLVASTSGEAWGFEGTSVPHAHDVNGSVCKI